MTTQDYDALDFDKLLNVQAALMLRLDRVDYERLTAVDPAAAASTPKTAGGTADSTTSSSSAASTCERSARRTNAASAN